MELELVNFGCYENRKFSFPSKGIVLINGSSGIGKSTIFRAIYFALSGEGQKIITYGQKKCSVRYSFRNFEIIRSKGPGRLILNTNSKTYENEEAQSIINSIYGENIYMSSYIAQKSNNGLLSLTPSAKLEYLQQITLDNKQIEEIKEKIKGKITKLKNEILITTNSIDIYKKELSDLNFTDIKKIRSPDIIINEQKEIKNSITDIEQKMENSKKLLDDNSKKLIDAQFYTEYSNKMKDIEKIIDINEFLISNFNINDIKNELTKLKLQLEYSNMVIEYSNNKKKEDEINLNYKKEIDEKLSKLPQDLYNKKKMCVLIRDSIIKYNEVSSKIDANFIKENSEKVILSIQNKIDELLSENISLDNKIQDYKLRQIVQSCPKCNTSLQISNNKIVTSESKGLNSNDIEDEKQCKTRKIEINTLIQKNKKELENIKKIYTLQINILNDLSKLEKPNVSLDFINKKINTIDKDISDFEKYSNVKFDYSNTLLSMKKKCLEFKKKHNIERCELDILDKKISENQKILENNKYFEEYNLLKSKKEKYFNIDISKLNSDNLLLNNNISSYKENINKLNKLYNSTYEELSLSSKYQQVIKLKEKLQDFNNNEKLLLKSLTSYESFFKKLKEAESLSISHTISSINSTSNDILSKFFEDDINITLFPFKQSKTNSNKPEINISIDYKGNSLDSIYTLSGGEIDRINLAFALAVNKISNSPLLILDESLSSLNGDLIFKIINSLKDVMNNELILTTLHQANEGIFDHVINL